jgi:Tol biopolymer transport system component
LGVLIVISIDNRFLIPLFILVAVILNGCGSKIVQTDAVAGTVTDSLTAISTLDSEVTKTSTQLPTATVTLHPPTDTPQPTPTPSPMPPLSGSGGGVIAFVSELSGAPGIYIMNADGSDQRMLSDEYDTHPDWSPDGKKIAFSTRRSDVVAIYSIDLASMDVQQLTNTDRSPSAPDWSPDGKQLAIVYNPAHPGIDYELYLMSSAGGSFRQLTDSTGYQTHASPDWSPEGRRISFAADLEGNYDIYLMDPDGSNVEKLTSHVADDRSPAWSPNGHRIAFETYRDGDWEIYVMNADGSNLQRISNSPAKDLWPTWSPDGERIAFQTDRDGDWEIYVMDADGGNQQQLTYNEVKDSEPAWKP